MKRIGSAVHKIPCRQESVTQTPKLALRSTGSGPKKKNMSTLTSSGCGGHGGAVVVRGWDGGEEGDGGEDEGKTIERLGCTLVDMD